VYDKNIILIGYSGHGFVVADAALENQLYIIRYTDTARSSSNPFHL
jgi:acetyltransferase EpsM